MTGCTSIKGCNLEDKVACYNKKESAFEIEEGAVLRIAVETEQFGDALVSLWNQYHPEYPDVIDYVIAEDYTRQYQQATDLIFMNESEVSLLWNYLQPIHEENSEQIQKYMPEREKSLLNYKEDYFIPMSYEGMLFAYNETLLEDIGVDLTDDNQDGLVDAIDSWEKILLLSELWQNEDNKVDILFPFQSTERYSFYPFLTAGDWQFCESNIAEQPGFDSEEFLSSLRFIEQLGQQDWYINKEENNTYAYEQALDEDTLLTMIAPWMYYQNIEETQQVNYRFSHMPSYQGNILTPLTEIKGYILSKDCKYPSAANEVIRILRSKEGLQAYIDNTDSVPYIKTDDFVIEDNKKEQIIAYAYSVSEPLIALKGNTAVRAWQMYYEIDWLSVMNRLMNREITTEVAQEEIVRLSSDWLDQYGGKGE